MASFVAKVLTSAGQLETHEAAMKLQQLSKKVEQLKLEVHELSTSKASNFVPKLHSTEQQVAEVETIKQEMEQVSNRIENQIKSQLTVSTGEFQSLTSQLENVNSMVAVLDKLVELQDGLETITEAVENHEYSAAADAVLLVKSLLSKPGYRHEDEIAILAAIKSESLIQLENLKAELINGWTDMISWKVPDDKNRDTSKPLVAELKIVKKGKSSDVLSKLVIGMKKMNILEDKMKKFCGVLLDRMIMPLMVNRCVEVKNSEVNQGTILTVTILPVEAEADDDVTWPTPQDMFTNLDRVLKFLQTNLLYVPIAETAGEAEPAITLMTRLGEHVAEQSLTAAVKECLIKAIPSSNKDLEEFQEVLNFTESVHQSLLQMCFIPSDNTILMDYVENVNVLFANKKCQGILETARTLMTTEVHSTVRVTQDKPMGELPPLMKGQDGAKRVRRDDLAGQLLLSEKTFHLPTCHISTSVQELVTMAYETLHEATESSEQCAIQMFCAVRYMFELFCDVFPTYHRQSLETLPQFTALHYNNCMYISHHLLTLGHQFSKKLPDNINTTFVDLVPKIRRLGTESFIQQLARQKAQILEYLAAANGFVGVSEVEAFFATKKAVKQMLHQFQHLKKVWQEVLPPSNYRKAIGGLLNSVLTEITDSITSLEDISTDDTKQLSGLLAMIADGTPELFQGDDSPVVTLEIQRNVSKWQRFCELDIILNASMIDITDRWAAGKGPLAVAFSANEVKQLIRALFQNTDRRAAMLAKIK